VRRPYAPPGLVEYGRLHELTLGSTGPKADASVETTQRTITIISNVNSTDPACGNLASVQCAPLG
jgi:hypothetical protein